MNSGLLFSSASFTWGLHSICRLHRTPFAPQIVLQQIPPPYSIYSFQYAAEVMGFSSALRNASLREVAELPMPCLAVLQPSPVHNADTGTSISAQDGTEVHRIALLLKCEAGRLRYLTEGMTQPVEQSFTEFSAQYAGIVLLFEREAELPAEEHEQSKAFGFRWFFPELLRHKAIWRDVLLASLVIQLMALATPIFTQIVIDKVIAHHTTSTLIVIGTALGMFVLFTAAMTWSRQYLVLHTGNRIDSVLGSQVFEHLFKLPPRYFETRPTGVLVARIQGVETIREFITGVSVTLVLDVPFMLVFLGIMLFYSAALTAVTCLVLLAIALLSLAVTPLLRRKINHQFLLGARNQAFLTEYISGMETVKSLQMEPRLCDRYGDYLASYLKAGFETRQLSNTYNTVAHALEQVMMLGILVIGALLVMN